MQAAFFVLGLIAFIAAGAFIFVGLLRKKPSPDTRAPMQKTRTWFAIAVGVWIVCTAGVLASPSSRTAPSAADKYDQTWTQSYTSTSCTEWFDDMTQQERFAAAADMLVSTWHKSEGSDAFPMDSLITEFQGGISTACVVPTANVAETAVGVYLTEPRFAPPS